LPAFFISYLFYQTNGFFLTVVRVSAQFHYHPLIKFKCSKKPANHQAPALSVEAMLGVGIIIY